MILPTSFKHPLVRLFIGALSLLVVVSLSRSVYGLWRKRDYVRLRADTLQEVQAENDRLKKQVEASQKPEFIEKEAREKLGMTKEGEAVVILPKSQISGPNDQKKIEEVSNWKKWWRLFF
ncbi:septum formation initiator family protein [Candidatus Gottesmanbacteria bacterium]|nr:septum formation initiator family protein [Candidatus Gottesmanbacteria bacterium]